MLTIDVVLRKVGTIICIDKNLSFAQLKSHLEFIIPLFNIIYSNVKSCFSYLSTKKPRYEILPLQSFKLGKGGSCLCSLPIDSNPGNKIVLLSCDRMSCDLAAKLEGP